MRRYNPRREQPSDSHLSKFEGQKEIPISPFVHPTVTLGFISPDSLLRQNGKHCTLDRVQERKPLVL